MRQKNLFLIPIFVIIGLAAAFSAQATITCPTASPQGVGCASEPSQLYYCASSCRSMDAAYCPTNELAPVAPCTGLDTCGACNTCAASYLLCTASAYPTRSCTYNDPANHCASLTNSNCTAGSCASCVGGYSLCSTTHVCIATQSCEPWETFNACTNACEGAAPTLKLNYNSVNASNYIIQSSSPVLSIPPSGLIGIGTTAPDYLLHVGDLGYFDNWVYGLTPSSDDDYALTTVEYVNESLSLAGGGLWSGDVASNIWNLNSGNVGIGTTNPTVAKLDVRGGPVTSFYGSSSGATGMKFYAIGQLAQELWTYSAEQNTVRDLVLFGRTTVTAGQNGIGLRLKFDAVNSGNTRKNTAGISAILSDVASGAEKGALVLETGTAGVLSEKVRIDNTGNVGIGTTSPGQPLHIYNTASVSAPMVMLEGYNHILGLKGATPYAEYFNSTGTRLGWFGYGLNATDLYFSNDVAAKPIYFSTDGYTNVRMTILGTSGNVGIGTTAPGSLLDVNGLGNFSNFVYGFTPDIDDDYALTTVEYVNNSVLASAGEMASFVGVTAATYNGNQGGNSGYAYADSLCAAGAGAMADSHVCTVEEVLYSVRASVSIPDNIIFWILSGPPGYTASANDCEGRTTASSLSRGAVWDTNTSYPQGRGMLTLCNNSNVFGCCK